MRITIVNQHINDVMGGSELQCHLHARQLTQHANVTYLALNGRARVSEYGCTYPVETAYYNARDIWSGIINTAPDVVYWRSCRGMYSRIAPRLRKSGIPHVFSVSNHLDVFPMDALAVKRFRVANIRITASYIMQRRAWKYANAVAILNKDHLPYIRHARKFFLPNQIPDEESEWTWPRGYCLWVANYKQWKRPELVPSIARQIRELGLDLLMVGDNTGASFELSAYEPNLYELGARPIDQVNGMFRNALLYLHTGRPEGFGNVFLQAWRCGVPTISYEHDPSGYLNDFGPGGCAKGDWDKFVSLIRNYILYPQIYEQASASATSLFQSTFSSKMSSDRLYRELKRAANS